MLFKRFLVSLFFTICAVLGHSVEAWAHALTCESVFRNPVKVSTAIEKSLQALKESLQELNENLKAPRDANGDPLAPLKHLSGDPRDLAYVLQGSYRLLLEHPQASKLLSKKQISKLQAGLDQMKWLEKKLGKYQNSRDLVKAAEKIGVPDDFLQYLIGEKNNLARDISERLRERHFLTDEALAVEDLLKDLRGMKKLDGRVAIPYLPDSLYSEILRVKDKVELEMKPLILKTTYGFHEVEEGAHAFRRSLRWLKVYILAYKEHFSLVQKKGRLTADEKILREKYQNHPETELGPDGPILLKEMEYYRLIEMVADLRKIKGVGEIRQNLIEALADFGRWNGKIIHRDQAQALIEPYLESKLQNIEIRTQEILKQYEKNQAFRNMMMRSRL